MSASSFANAWLPISGLVRGVGAAAAGQLVEDGERLFGSGQPGQAAHPRHFARSACAMYSSLVVLDPDGRSRVLSWQNMPALTTNRR
ncbi:hypothetical protein ACGFX2_34390 [Streptomyces goshikiensis]|uniref:hypothetical protein n=1 Tax=Streptomyces goshikiensis TaxID=1942 RepID=UPI003722635C